jgi:hypothetical protein
MSFPVRPTCILRESEFSRCWEREKCRRVKVVEGVTGTELQFRGSLRGRDQTIF